MELFCGWNESKMQLSNEHFVWVRSSNPQLLKWHSTNALSDSIAPSKVTKEKSDFAIQIDRISAFWNEHSMNLQLENLVPSKSALLKAIFSNMQFSNIEPLNRELATVAELQCSQLIYSKLKLL
jgi:hypothetical protein